MAGVGLGVPTSFLPRWLEGGSCTCLLFARVAGGGRSVLTSFLPGWLKGGSCTCLLFAKVAGGGHGVLTSFLPGWLGGCSCTHLLFAWVAGGGRSVLTSFLPGRLEGGLSALSFCLNVRKMGGPLSLPRCEDDNGTWGGAGGGVSEGGIAYSSSQGEGGIALTPSLVCEDARFDSSQSSSLVSKQSSRTTVLAPFCSNRSCCCRGWGRGRSCRCRRRRRRVPSARTLPLLTPGVGSPSTGGLEPSSRSRHS